MSNTIEKMIQNKAYELGFEKCGIIPIQAMEGYKEKFEERMQKVKKVPVSEQYYRQRLGRLVNLLEEYPWAKSAVVAVIRYGKYRIPQTVKDYIGKAYLFDTRIDVKTEEYQNGLVMGQYLEDLGLRVATNPKTGIVGMRWAAMRAGLGIYFTRIRRDFGCFTMKKTADSTLSTVCGGQFIWPPFFIFIKINKSQIVLRTGNPAP